MAVEGFWATSSNQACFATTSESTTTEIHHVAFINDIASGCMNAGFDSYGYNGSTSTDQQAVVGVIAYNAAKMTSLCGSGISLIPQNVASGASYSDTSAGTHTFVAGAFSYAN